MAHMACLCHLAVQANGLKAKATKQHGNALALRARPYEAECELAGKLIEDVGEVAVLQASFFLKKYI